MTVLPAGAQAAVRAVSDADSLLLPVIRLGNPILRVRADEVPEAMLDGAELRALGDSLIHTMFEEQGVGLAAPQVAESLRLFAYWVPGEEGQPDQEPTVLVNPEIRPVGDDTEEGWEGCLSIPGLRGIVPRYTRIKVKARGIDGERTSFTANGFQARVIQHELDHLDGVVFLDRMTSMQSLAFEDEFLALVEHESDPIDSA